MQNESVKFKIEFNRRLIRFSIAILRFCDPFITKPLFRSISDQLIRSATSIGANVIEAKGASSTKDYIKFFDIALKSAYETKYWLVIFKDLLPDHNIDDLLKELDEISRIIASSLLTLKGKR